MVSAEFLERIRRSNGEGLEDFGNVVEVGFSRFGESFVVNRLEKAVLGEGIPSRLWGLLEFGDVGIDVVFFVVDGVSFGKGYFLR